MTTQDCGCLEFPGMCTICAGAPSAEVTAAREQVWSEIHKLTCDPSKNKSPLVQLHAIRVSTDSEVVDLWKKYQDSSL